MPDHPQKITFADTRDMGVRGVRRLGRSSQARGDQRA
jgi:hypothetical protein